MAFLGLAGAASTAGFAAFALFNVAYSGAYNPNLPAGDAVVNVSGVESSKALKKTMNKPSSTVSGQKEKVIKVAAADDATQDEPTIHYTNPPKRTAKRQAEVAKAVAALKASIKNIDYERARYHPLHFKPLISKASNEECLVCHSEILTHKPRATSPAGVKADNVLAWYQTLDTYAGKQETFHFRHLKSAYAKQVMNLSCNFCHKGNDPREESPDMQPGQKVFSGSATPNFTLRKMVNPSTTCLRCHGAFPFKFMDGVEGPWLQVRKDIEDEDTPNGCLTCHEETYRTNRHHVTYLNGANIEKLAKKSSDVCYGCHGGRQWYRINYPYPRHPWPDMDDETPSWAKNRPTKSDPEYQLKASSHK